MKQNNTLNLNLVIQLIQSTKDNFLIMKDCFKRHSENISQINTLTVAFDISTGRLVQYRNKKLALSLVILIDGFFSKTVSYFFLHLKAGIPFNSFDQMWAVDFALGIAFAFVIVFLSIIAMEMGLKTYRDIGRKSVPLHILGYSLLAVIPIVNIWMKLPGKSFDVMLNGVVPVLSFIFSCYIVYIYADANIRNKTKDSEMIKAHREKNRLLANEDKIKEASKRAKESIEGNATKLAIFLKDFEKDEATELLLSFIKNERYILDRHLFHCSSEGLMVNATGTLEDGFQDPFVSYYDQI